jgi:hypothetical protein
VNVGARLRGFWESVRPRTRRGAFQSAIAVVAGAAVLSVVLFVGAAMAWSPYLDFNLHPATDARARAALPLSYAGAGTCAACHATEAGRLASAGHAEIGCQSCHGPLNDHAIASSGTAAASAGTAVAVAVAVPKDDVCTRCHVQVLGRPAGQRQIVPTQHYVSACLQCHDPHTAIAARPPVVGHPLDNLPPCLTCHGPAGFKARNQRHPAIQADDKLCLECHAAGRGPAEDQLSR